MNNDPMLNFLTIVRRAYNHLHTQHDLTGNQASIIPICQGHSGKWPKRLDLNNPIPHVINQREWGIWRSLVFIQPKLGHHRQEGAIDLMVARLVRPSLLSHILLQLLTVFLRRMPQAERRKRWNGHQSLCYWSSTNETEILAAFWIRHFQESSLCSRSCVIHFWLVYIAKQAFRFDQLEPPSQAILYV